MQDILNKRQLEILLFVMRYKYGFRTALVDHFFKGLSRNVPSRNLTKLEKLGYLKSVTIPANISSLMKQEKIYYATQKGAKVVAEELDVIQEDLGFKKVVYPPKSINHIYHKKQLINFLIALDKDLEGTQTTIKHLTTDGERINQNGQQIVASQINTEDKKFVLVPDIAFVLKNRQDQEVVFFVEIDTAKETIRGRLEATKKNTLLYKYNLYERILKDGYWKSQINTTANAFKVLTVTESQKHIQGIISKVQAHLKWGQIFLFTIHESIKNNGVLGNKEWRNLDSVDGDDRTGIL